jgi:hypothetical protein
MSIYYAVHIQVEEGGFRKGWEISTKKLRTTMLELGDLGDLGHLKPHGSRPQDRPISDLVPWTLVTVAPSTAC